MNFSRYSLEANFIKSEFSPVNYKLQMLLDSANKINNITSDLASMNQL